MTHTLRVEVNPTAVSLAETIAEAARHVPFLVLRDRLFFDLADELGGDKQATQHLCRVATSTGRPIAVNLPTEEGSTTVFVSPHGWTSERLRGWAGGHHQALEAMFGEATVRGEV